MVLWLSRASLIPLESALSAQGKLYTFDHQGIGRFFPADVLLFGSINLGWLIENAIDCDLSDALNGLVVSIGINGKLVVGNRESDISGRACL